MDYLSRLLLQISALLLIYSAGVVLLLLWLIYPLLVGVIGLVTLVMYFTRPRQMVLTACGTAAWATYDLLRSRKMINRGKGFLLGYIDRPPLTLGDRFTALVDRSLSDKEACEEFLTPSKKSLVYLPPDTCHVSVYAKTGAGKGVSCLIPWLLTNDESAVIVDFSGELTLLTAEFREKVMGHEVRILDPFKQVTQ